MFEKFDIDLLKQNHPIGYKYIIYSPKVEESDCFEYLHAHHRRCGNVNRCLQICPTKLSEVYCYHGGLHFKATIVITPQETLKCQSLDYTTVVSWEAPTPR
jgi:ferredoxin